MKDSNPGSFLLEAYDTERLKTLSVWSCFTEDDLGFRPAARARTPLEHMVHQCLSEDTWMSGMLDVRIHLPVLPKSEDRISFLRHYAQASELRHRILSERDSVWWTEDGGFFDVTRSKAWIFLRRLTHSAHHRGQLTVYLRLLGRPLYSTYGPTADTGGLFLNHAPTIYRYGSIERLLSAEEAGGEWPPLPGPGQKPATERP